MKPSAVLLKQSNKKIRTDTHKDKYSNPRACAPRVNDAEAQNGDNFKVCKMSFCLVFKQALHHITVVIDLSPF